MNKEEMQAIRYLLQAAERYFSVKPTEYRKPFETYEDLIAAYRYASKVFAKMPKEEASES